MARPQPRYKKGDRIGGRYQVHEVKMGGMGEVYLSLDLKEGIPIALKTFQQRFLTNPKLRTAFENEVATWIALEKHPHIVRCYMMDMIDNQPFMFLEWVIGDEDRGVDLRSWLRRGPLDPRVALDFVIDICRGLSYANNKQPGLVHRDLKPDNILVTPTQLAKITDFGLAQIVQTTGLKIEAEHETDQGRSLFGQGDLVGTPAYMAPEQWRGDELDARTDIYAVGCILGEMLTGRVLFQAKSRAGLRRQHLETNASNLLKGQNLPRAIHNLLEHCLAKARGARFATIDDLLADLTSIYQQQFNTQPKNHPISQDFTAVDYVNRGGTYDKLHRYDEALADHNRAIQLDPTLSQAYNNRGLTYHNLKRYHEALADCDQAIQLDPNLIIVYPNRGNTYARLRRYEEAFADYNRAIQLDPTSVSAYLNRANTYSNLRRYDEALADYNQAIQIDPTLTQPYVNRGGTYDELQRYDEAIADYHRAIQLDPRNTTAYYNRGNTSRKLQRYSEALADYDQAIRLDPNYSQAYNNRGFTYYKLQKYDEALTNYNQAIKLDPNSAETYNNRGLTYYNLQRYDKARFDFDQAIQLDPTLAQAYNNRGNIYIILQQYDEALADYDRAIQLDPNYPEACNNRGSTYARLQRHDNALADFNRAIQLDPNFIAPYFNMGAELGNQGKWREALPYFEKAAQLGDPNGMQYVMEIRKMLKG